MSNLRAPQSNPTAPPRATLPTRWTQLRPHAQQRALTNSTARFNFVAAGRSSGKTELSKRKLVMALARDVPGCANPLYFAAGPTNDQMKRVWWQDLKDLTPPLWITRVCETDMSIHTVFGSTLYVIGLDKPQRIEGNQFCGGVVDESSDIKPGAYARSIRPTLGMYAGWCDRIGVPKRFGVGAEEFRKGCEAPGPAGSSFWWPASSVLSPQEIQDAQDAIGVDDYEEQYNAKWLHSVGAVFSGFDAQQTVRSCAYDPSRRVFVGCDFNVDNMSWVLGHVDEAVGSGVGTLEVFDEIFARNTNTSQTLSTLWGRYSSHASGWTFTGDASSKARKTSATVTDYVQILNDTRFANAAGGRTVDFPRANPGVRDRIAATNALLCSASGTRRLHVDPACRKLIDDLRLRSSTNTDADRGHMTDALGYLIWQKLPLTAQRTGSRRLVIMPTPAKW